MGELEKRIKGILHANQESKIELKMDDDVGNAVFGIIETNLSLILTYIQEAKQEFPIDITWTDVDGEHTQALTTDIQRLFFWYQKWFGDEKKVK